MAVLIDADVIINAERGSFDLFGWLESRSEEEFMLAAITVAELQYGVERAPAAHRSRRMQFLEQVFQSFEVIPYTERTALEHGRLWAELEARGTMIAAHDLILAATATEGGYVVATFNTRHLAAIQGLRLVVLATH
jgi:tRNA(fMet)-specific endonuclease VapC